MTLEERKERFFKFDGCTATVCDDCVYHGGRGLCADRIRDDAREILKAETLRAEAAEEVARTIKNMDDAATIAEAMKPRVYEAPLYPSDRDEIRELVRRKTEVPDLVAHFIQEINELCSNLNNLAALVGKREQLLKGTDPAGIGIEDDFLVDCINVSVAEVIEEAADVHNYLFVLGFDRLFTGFPDDRDHKLARWANRLNGVSDE